MATGSTNSEIRERLHVGTETVKTHVSRVLAKLELRDRVHAVRFAGRHVRVVSHLPAASDKRQNRTGFRPRHGENAVPWCYGRQT